MFGADAGGAIWIAFKGKKGDATMGIARISDTEYGIIPVEDLRENPEVAKMYEDKLPCTLAELFECTDVWAYLQ